MRLYAAEFRFLDAIPVDGRHRCMVSADHIMIEQAQMKWRYPMNADQLARELQSVGMTCFIKHISIFANLQIDNAEAADRLSAIERYTKGGIVRRVSHARRIVSAGKIKEAVTLIANSKLEDEVTALARQWLITPTNATMQRKQIPTGRSQDT